LIANVFASSVETKVKGYGIGSHAWADLERISPIAAAELANTESNKAAGAIAGSLLSE
jgi:hypothetical protein